MATFVGSAGGGGRAPYLSITLVSRTASKAVVRYAFGSNAVSGYSTWGTFTGTLTTNGGSFSVSASVPSGASATHKTVDVTFNTAAAFTATGSVTGSIAGASGWTSTSLSGSLAVAAGGAAPGVPSNFAVTRTGDTTATLSFTKGSDATTTQITASQNSGTWYNLASSSGSSQAVMGLLVDSFWRFQLYSKNTAGSSAVVGPYNYYTKPKTPTKPVLGSSRLVSWTLPSKYKHGVEVQRTDNGGSTVTPYSLGAVTSWTDPAAQAPLTQYRVRAWVGPSVDTAKTYSDWSSWSETAMGVTYKAPQVTAMTAVRCNSAGTPTETGRYVKVTASGTASSVKTPAGIETNKMVRRFGYRAVGDSSWSDYIMPSTNAANWAGVEQIIGANLITEAGSWEISVGVADSYTTTTSRSVMTVPASKVAFSVGPTGTGHGKAWQQGALDVSGDAYLDGTLYGGIVETDDPRLLRSKGVGGFQRGSVSSGQLDKNTGVSGTVTFPQAYGKAPIVIPVAYSARINVQIGANAVTTTGFTWWMRNDSNANASAADVGFAWVAIPI